MRIILTTSDKYRHLVQSCGTWLNMYWPGNRVTVLGFKEPQELPENFDFVSMGEQEDYGTDWTTPVRGAIDELAPDRFILMLEDYFLTHPVMANEIKPLFNRPFRDAEKIDLSGDRAQFPHGPVKLGDIDIVISGRNRLIESSQTARYRSSLQMAIWSKEYFLKLCVPGRNIWEFELIGEKEAMNDGARILGTEIPLVRYRNVVLKGKIK